MGKMKPGPFNVRGWIVQLSKHSHAPLTMTWQTCVTSYLPDMSCFLSLSHDAMLSISIHNRWISKEKSEMNIKFPFSEHFLLTIRHKAFGAFVGVSTTAKIYPDKRSHDGRLEQGSVSLHQISFPGVHHPGLTQPGHGPGDLHLWGEFQEVRRLPAPRGADGPGNGFNGATTGRTWSVCKKPN